MKNIMYSIFFFILSIFVLHGCGTSVSDEFPKFNEEYQKIKKSADWVEFMEGYNILKPPYPTGWSKKLYNDELFNNPEFRFLAERMMINGSKIDGQLGSLILVLKNKEIQNYVFKEKEAIFKVSYFFVEDFSKDNASELLNKLLSETMPIFNGLEHEYRKLKFEK